MQQTDPFVQFKAAQREGWGLFAPLETLTTIPAAKLVDYAQVKSGLHVLDVGCGTGVVAVTAAKLNAKVKGMDLSPVLLDRAKWNAQTAGVEIEFTEGDVEALPYKDATFDVVLSQFGHMFAPRPEIAVKEMLRVLKPGGTIAFSTWPPELYTGQMFALVSKYLPPPPGVAPTPLWGDPNIVKERLGSAVKNLMFARDNMSVPALSPQHMRANFNKNVAPIIKLMEVLKDQPDKIRLFENELDSLIARFTTQNTLRQDFLMTKAIKI